MNLGLGTERWDDLLTRVTRLAIAVGQDQLSAFGQVTAEAKADGSLVTACDRQSDRVLRQGLEPLLSGAAFLTEEGSQIMPESDWVWVVDPLDGTTNFARGIPVWAISIALLHHGEPVLGVVHLPGLGRTYRGLWGAAGGLQCPTLADMNGVPLRRAADFSSSHLFSFCTRSIGVLQDDSVRALPFPCKIRMLGVATYNLLSVLDGAMVGALEATPKVWDVAAVVAIARAVGVDWDWLHGNPFPLRAGVDYAARAYPSLLLAGPTLAPTFRPWRSAFLAGRG